MTRKSWHAPLCRLLLVPLLLLAACSEEPPAPIGAQDVSPHRDHNVLLITLDTLRADYLGCYGNQEVSTPHVDGLATRGVRFDQAVVQVPLTTPSHASILTGTYPQVHKIRDMGGFVLDSQVPPLAVALKDQGYDTAAFVSAAVLNHRYGLDRGFDVYDDDMGEGPADDKLPGVVAEIRGDVVTNRVAQWFEKRRQETPSGKPFLLWVHYYDPHFPYDPPEPYRSRYRGDPYAGEVAFTDEQVGHLLRLLEDGGQLDRTLIILMADHGEGLGDHREQRHGVFLYDSTVRIPLVLAGPDLPAGRVVEQQVRSIDIVPTILDYLGLSPGDHVQGVSLLPAAARGESVPTEYSYLETLYPKTQMRWSELRSMRTGEWKLIVAPTPELYNLRTDPGETQNVSGPHSDVVERLREEIWKVDGPPGSQGTIESQPLDEETWEALRALGYVSAGTSRRLRMDASGPDPKDRLQVLETLDRATDLMNHDNFGEAAVLLEKSLDEDPTNPLIYQYLGHCLQETQRFEKARKVYLEAIEQGAETDRTHAELGEIAIRLGDLNQAVESLDRATRLNPKNLDNFSNLANVYLQLGRIGDAETAVRAILAQNDTHGGAYNLLGLIHIHRNERTLARRSFERAIQYDPNLAEPYMNLGLLAQQTDDRQGAVRYYKLFLQKAGDPRYREIIPRVKGALRELESGLQENR